MNRRTKRLLLASIGVVVLGGLAIPKIISTQSNAREATAKKPGAGPPQVAVKAYVVEPERLDDRIFVTGNVLPNEEVELRGEVAGKVTAINFSEGAHVAKGTLLVKINDADLQAQLKKAIYRKQLLEARENRQRTLLQKDAVSQADYDEALNELNTSAAEIDLLKAQIDRTEIRAPFSGIVGLRYISTGSYISPTTRIATLHNVDPVKIDFAVPEKYARTVRKGSDISFTIGGSHEEFKGTVYAVEPKIDPETRTMQIRALCSNSRSTIAPGAFAEIELVLKEMGDALMVPTEAVVPELNGKKVFLVKDGKAESRPIVAGIRTSTKIQVVEGLAAGDTVLTTGLLQVRPGSPLKITDVQ